MCKRPFDHSRNNGCDRKYFEFLSCWFRKDKTDTEPTNKNISATSFNQGYYQKFFKEGRKLGRGAGGSVFLCQHQIEGIPLGEYAVKKVPVGDDKKWLERLLREVHILERLRHPNIIEYKHTWIEIHKPTKFGPAVPCLFILMEYANGGNLEDLVLAELTDEEEEVEKKTSKSKKGKRESPVQIGYMDELDIVKIFLSAAKGLQHLHSLGILHRDLKPANLMLNYDRDTVSEPTVLLSDFGECSEKNENIAMRTGATGTMEFVAPELFKVDEVTKGFEYEHSVQTDIWSLGMILYFMYFAKLPYKNVEDIDALREDLLTMKKIAIPKDERPISVAMGQLLARMLDVDPDLRPDLKTIIRVAEGFLITPRKRKTSFNMSPPLRALASSNPVPALEMTPSSPTSMRTNLKATSSHLRSNASIACKILTLATLGWQIYGCYPWSLSTGALVAAFLFLFSLRSRYNFRVILAVTLLDVFLLFSSPKGRYCSSNN